MHFRLADLERKRAYKLIAGAIIPRPIALVTTLGATGRCNAAPFSAFNYMSEDPPLVALGLQVHPDGSARAGELKDTTRNILERGEFVVNLADEAMLAGMVDCATDFPAEISEPEAVGLALAPSVSVAVPRLAECPVAFECRRVVILNFSAFRSVLIGEIVSAYFRDGILDPTTLDINLSAYRPIGRLFGSLYCRVADTIAMPMKSYPKWLSERSDQAADG
jgi:flavin reductase (DIM6/NTAB) family NADH-FMN oxidoreductase RutF